MWINIPYMEHLVSIYIHTHIFRIILRRGYHLYPEKLSGRSESLAASRSHQNPVTSSNHVWKWLMIDNSGWSWFNRISVGQNRLILWLTWILIWINPDWSYRSTMVHHTVGICNDLRTPWITFTAGQPKLVWHQDQLRDQGRRIQGARARSTQLGKLVDRWSFRIVGPPGSKHVTEESLSLSLSIWLYV